MTQTPDEGPTSDNAGKPSLWRTPGAFLRRKLRLTLNDVLGRLHLRVFDTVDMTTIRTTTRFKHVIDVGVAQGTPDLYARCPDALIELFEPQPRFQILLEQGLMRQRTCRLHKMALGDVDGEAQFHMTGPASASLLGTGEKPGRTFPTITVPVRRLDGVLTAADLQRPALLKIDTEGYERAVLQGAEGLLPAIDAVIVEVHLGKANAYKPQDILDILGRHGFGMIDVLDREVRNGQVTCLDFVFERPQRT